MAASCSGPVRSLVPSLKKGFCIQHTSPMAKSNASCLFSSRKARTHADGSCVPASAPVAATTGSAELTRRTTGGGARVSSSTSSTIALASSGSAASAPSAASATVASAAGAAAGAASSGAPTTRSDNST